MRTNRSARNSSIPLRSGSNEPMATPRLPSAQVAAYTELLSERIRLQMRFCDLDRQMNALAEAIQLAKPDWQPPKKIATVPRQPVLPRGAVLTMVATIMCERKEAKGPEIADEIARRYCLNPAPGKERNNLVSAVTMALRRLERKRFLQAMPHTAGGPITFKLVE